MRVFSNTAASLDGRIATVAFDHVRIGSHADLVGMSRLRAQADAVLVGGQTFRNWPLPLVENPAHLEAAVGRDKPVVNAVLTRSGVMSASARRFPDPRVELLVLGGPQVDVDAHQQRFGAQVEQTAQPSIGWALDRLAARGCRSVLIEAGGDLIFQALDADRLDEVYLTLCPWVIGGKGAPSLADGRGFGASELRRLHMLDCRREGDELFLHYEVVKGAQTPTTDESSLT